MAFVHHTASSNSYTKAQAPAAVRSIYAYDTKGLGWSDIAYNVLVDKYGQVFEGRAGGLDACRAVGGDRWLQPVDVLGVRTRHLHDHGADLRDGHEHRAHPRLEARALSPQSRWHRDTGRLQRYGDDLALRQRRVPPFSVISGHRDAGLTACPGNLLYAKLPTIRSAVKRLMGAAIFAPRISPFVVDKGSTTPVTLSATAMNAQQWQLLVADASGHTVRTVSGSAGAGKPFSVMWNVHSSTAPGCGPASTP